MMQRYQDRFQALGSAAQFTLVGAITPEEAREIMAGLRHATDAFEQRFSRFRADSELTHVNSRAGERTAISPEFRDLLQASRHMAEETRGLYNPFILPSLQQAGYVGSWPEPQAAPEGADYRRRKPVAIENLEIGQDWTRMPEYGALDFGGIGKGYLLDQLADKVRTHGLEGYWLSLGGDIVLEGYDLHREAWRVGVQSAVDPNAAVADISCSPDRQAIATSGVTRRRGEANGKPWHHIIDPRTAEPAESQVLTATVVAGSAQSADVYAKCVVIGGASLAAKYRKKNLIDAYYVQQSEGPQLVRSNTGKELNNG